MILQAGLQRRDRGAVSLHQRNNQRWALVCPSARPRISPRRSTAPGVRPPPIPKAKRGESPPSFGLNLPTGNSVRHGSIGFTSGPLRPACLQPPLLPRSGREQEGLFLHQPGSQPPACSGVSPACLRLLRAPSSCGSRCPSSPGAVHTAGEAVCAQHLPSCRFSCVSSALCFRLTAPRAFRGGYAGDGSGERAGGLPGSVDS